MGLTASTEQERAEFIKWATDALEANPEQCLLFEDEFADPLTNAAWFAWQAARRAQVVAVPQGLREAVLEEREACAQVLDAMAAEAEADLDPSSVVAYYRDRAAAIRARGKPEQPALAAAPQPPEAACNPSLQPELATLAAPVQMPEPAVPFAVFDCHGFYTEKPNAKQAQAFCDHYNKRDADGGGSAPYTVQALYTEHQVRQLLADHGIT